MDDKRLNDLEIRYTYMEELLRELNIIVAQQQNRIDMLEREIIDMVKVGAKSDVQSGRSLRDELPPHY